MQHASEDGLNVHALVQASIMPGRRTTKYNPPPFGGVLRRIRERIGMTQVELARRMNQSVSYISLLESGQRRPTERVLANVRAAVELTEDELAELTDAAQIPDRAEQLVQHTVNALDSLGDASDFQQVLLREDLDRVLRGYLTLLTAYKHLGANRFSQARSAFEQIVPSPPTTFSTMLPVALRANAGVGLADVTLKQGDLKVAQDAINTAMALLRDELPQSAQPLHAEAEALQGLIHLRAGDYSSAAFHMKQALRIYRDMKGTGSVDNAVSAVGLTKSYNRLALLALLTGDPGLASSYCESALDELHAVSPDPDDLTNTQRLRIHALQAWVLANTGKYEKAAELRERTRSAYEKLKDDYGVAKSLLYMGDDARHEIQEAVEPTSQDDLDTAQTRSDYIRSRLKNARIRKLVRAAAGNYQEAITRLETLGEALLLGRAYRGLGIMVCYSALLEPDPDIRAKTFPMSKKLLLRALELETKAEQGRRVPGVQESLARLEWDQHHLAAARDYFNQAMRNLQYMAHREDVAAGQQLKRYSDAVDAINRELSIPIPPIVPLLPNNGSKEWRELCLLLAQEVADAIVRCGSMPESRSSLSLPWTQRLLDLDQDPGPRIIAQGQLSFSHEQRPLRNHSISIPDNERDEAERLHIARFDACEARIREADEQENSDGAYVDLCVRNVVAEAVRNNSNEHSRHRVYNALRRLRRWPNGFHLYVIDEPIPIHFAVKGSISLIELTSEAHGLEPRFHDICSNLSDEVCYPFEDRALAITLRAIFAEMIRIAKKRYDPQRDVEPWLESLIADEMVPAL